MEGRSKCHNEDMKGERELVPRPPAAIGNAQ